VPSEGEQPVGPLQIAVFLDELALLAVLCIAGALIGGGTVASTLRAIFFPVAAAVIWGQWLAPRARRRLAYPARLAAKLALVAVASLLLALSGPFWWGVAFFVISEPLLTAGELSER
jgi:hypothetical protein